MLAGEPDVAIGRVLGDAHQPPRLTNAAAFADMVQDGHDPLRRQFGVVKGRALAFGESRLAGRAVELTDGLFLADPSADGEISLGSLAVQGALRSLTAY